MHSDAIITEYKGFPQLARLSLVLSAPLEARVTGGSDLHRRRASRKVLTKKCKFRFNFHHAQTLRVPGNQAFCART